MWRSQGIRNCGQHRLHGVSLLPIVGDPAWGFRGALKKYYDIFPLDFQKRRDYMGSDNFVSFAIGQGWFDSDAGRPFNVTKIYGVDEEMTLRSEMERELRAAAPIDLRTMMNAVRDPRIATDSTGYGQVAQLKDNGRPEMNVLAPYLLGQPGRFIYLPNIVLIKQIFVTNSISRMHPAKLIIMASGIVD